MVQIDFSGLRDLSPSAFKLMVFFLDQVQTRQTSTFSLSLAELGYEAGLQPPVRYPALRKGRDSQVRHALQELIDRGLVEKQGQRGPVPNTYHVKVK